MVERIAPIVEYFPINKSKTSKNVNFHILDSRKNNENTVYVNSIIAELKSHKGIYIFYDSKGSAIYCGKAQRQYLWDEMNSAFNRDRNYLQQIFRTKHPTKNGEYRPYEERERPIRPEYIVLHQMASYFSAYIIEPIGMISSLEALIVRAFANDLLNKKMEKFPIRSDSSTEAQDSD